MFSVAQIIAWPLEAGGEEKKAVTDAWGGSPSGLRLLTSPAPFSHRVFVS